MEVNQTHPIKLAFCELLKRYSNDENYKALSPEKKLVRNRWNLAFTLYKNPYLKRERKDYVKEQSIYHAGNQYFFLNILVNRFENFVLRQA